MADFRKSKRCTRCYWQKLRPHGMLVQCYNLYIQQQKKVIKVIERNVANLINRRIETKFAVLDNGKVRKRKQPSEPPKDMEQAVLILDSLHALNPVLASTCEMSALCGLRYSDSSWLSFRDFYDEQGEWKEFMLICQQKVYRMRETKGLQREKVDTNYKFDKALAIQKSLVKCYINDEMKKIVKERKSLAPKGCDLLFPNRRSQVVSNGITYHRPMSTYSADKAHSRLQKELCLNIKLGTHSWRKMFANRVLRESGNNITVTRDLLGHSCLSSTSRYVDGEDGEILDIIKKIGGYHHG